MEEVINLSEFEELLDEDGFQLFEENLASVFEYLRDKELLHDKKQRYIFLVSKVSGGDDPFRYLKEREGTIRKLLNYWKGTFREKFSEGKLDEIINGRKFKMEMYEKDAERKSAWGLYGSTMRLQREIADYQKAEKLPPVEKEREMRRLRSRTNNLIIGG
jgi:hypothetical protein